MEKLRSSSTNKNMPQEEHAQPKSFTYTKAHGSHIWLDDDQHPYLDLIMAYGSVNFGHTNPKIIDIVSESAKKYDNSSPFVYPERTELTSHLVNQLPYQIAEDYQVYYSIGGAKCVESAIELARLATGKKGVVSFTGSFHGFSTSVIGISDRRFYSQQHDQFEQEAVYNVAFPSSEDETSSSLVDLETILTQNHDISCVIMESAQGLAGFRTAPQSFFTGVQDLVNRYGVLLILDDILLGVGRVGGLYSFGGLGIYPDMVLLGKSLAGGYYPLSAIVASQRLFDKAGVYCGGLDATFTNNPFGISIANGIQRMIQSDNLYAHTASSAQRFESIMHSLLEEHREHIVTMFVFGFAASIRFTSNAIANAVKDICLNEHMIIQLAGMEQECIRMTPSILISDYELSQLHATLDGAMKKVFSVEPT
jgi:4-aminobutyrate aminotransferase-like enzyme